MPLRRLFPFLAHRRPQAPEEETITFDSQALERKVTIDIYLPPNYPLDSKRPLPLLLFNDGQDLRRMPALHSQLMEVWSRGPSHRFALAALHAGERRMREYGTAERADFANRGDLAEPYERFVLEELIPYLQRHYPLADDPTLRAFAGFSLGALSALNIVWRNPDYFRTAGVFSGSLWWRSKKFDPKDPDGNRIIHELIGAGPKRYGFRCWLQAGTEDETEDRNNNGIIDAIDDTVHLIGVFKNLGYREGKDIHYVEVQGGRHEPATWSKVMPDFFRWWC